MAPFLHGVIMNIVPPQPLDVVAWVTIRLHANGSLSTQGTIGDKRMALHMLDQARDSIKRQVPDDKAVVLASAADVDIMPALPTRDMGDIPFAERGDP